MAVGVSRHPVHLFLDSLSIPDRTESWRTLIAEGSSVLVAEADEPRVVGFVSFGPTRDDDAASHVGEVYALYVSEDLAGTGIGFELLREAEAALWASGSTEATLWTLKESDRARRFYERQGWATNGATKAGRAQAGDLDVELREVRYRKALAP